MFFLQFKFGLIFIKGKKVYKQILMYLVFEKTKWFDKRFGQFLQGSLSLQVHHCNLDNWENGASGDGF